VSFVSTAQTVPRSASVALTAAPLMGAPLGSVYGAYDGRGYFLAHAGVNTAAIPTSVSRTRNLLAKFFHRTASSRAPLLGV